MNSTVVRALLARGMLAGLGAGVLAFVFAYLVGEGPVGAAIAFEESGSHEHGEELVSRSVQSTAGLATGVLVFGVAIGGIMARAFCFALASSRSSTRSSRPSGSSTRERPAARSPRSWPDRVGSAGGAPGGTYEVPCSCRMVPPSLFLASSRCSALALTTQPGPTRYLPP